MWCIDLERLYQLFVSSNSFLYQSTKRHSPTPPLSIPSLTHSLLCPCPPLPIPSLTHSLRYPLTNPIYTRIPSVVLWFVWSQDFVASSAFRYFISIARTSQGNGAVNLIAALHSFLWHRRPVHSHRPLRPLPIPPPTPCSGERRKSRLMVLMYPSLFSSFCLVFFFLIPSTSSFTFLQPFPYFHSLPVPPVISLLLMFPPPLLLLHVIDAPSFDPSRNLAMSEVKISLPLSLHLSLLPPFLYPSLPPFLRSSLPTSPTATYSAPMDASWACTSPRPIGPLVSFNRSLPPSASVAVSSSWTTALCSQ